ncbi:hypothetical protein QTV43_000385 [Vibrio vulnificus]|nr:hypothetical protein [Vibrio vulnificus]
MFSKNKLLAGIIGSVLLAGCNSGSNTGAGANDNGSSVDGANPTTNPEEAAHSFNLTSFSTTGFADLVMPSVQLEWDNSELSDETVYKLCQLDKSKPNECDSLVSQTGGNSLKFDLPNLLPMGSELFLLAQDGEVVSKSTVAEFGQDSIDKLTTHSYMASQSISSESMLELGDLLNSPQIEHYSSAYVASSAPFLTLSTNAAGDANYLGEVYLSGVLPSGVLASAIDLDFSVQHTHAAKAHYAVALNKTEDTIKGILSVDLTNNKPFFIEASSLHDQSFSVVQILGVGSRFIVLDIIDNSTDRNRLDRVAIHYSDAFDSYVVHKNLPVRGQGGGNDGNQFIVTDNSVTQSVYDSSTGELSLFTIDNISTTPTESKVVANIPSDQNGPFEIEGFSIEYSPETGYVTLAPYMTLVGQVPASSMVDWTGTNGFSAFKFESLSDSSFVPTFYALQSDAELLSQMAGAPVNLDARTKVISRYDAKTLGMLKVTTLTSDTGSMTLLVSQALNALYRMVEGYEIV